MRAHTFIRWLATLIVGGNAAAAAQPPPALSAASFSAEPDINTLMVVIREMEGANKKDSALRPVGVMRATVDGKEIEINIASFLLLGDMHIRFVYDRPTTLIGLTAEQFAKLGLSPEQAMRIAVKNIERSYGKPHYSPWEGGLFIVEGESADLSSSYFLDTEFWQGLLKLHPEGLVVGVPKRGGLLFALASDARAVEEFRRSIVPLFDSSENMRVSSALYLFKDYRWSVFQNPRPTH